MKYKVGDRVKIKSRDWYNENKDNNREIRFENGIFTTLKATFLGQIMTIEEITLEKQYILMEDRYKTLWTDEMIEGLVEEETALNKWNGLKVELELSKSIIGVSNVESLHGERFMSGFVKAIIPPEDYIFKDENGNVINATKIVLEKKKKEYPKTYEECCKVLGYDDREVYCIFHTGADETLFEALYRLKVCRDAYWKIAGEEMGMEKPWELSIGTSIYYIYYNRRVGIIKNDYGDDIQGNVILAFPTEEMRDAFYENFKELINECKKLL